MDAKPAIIVVEDEALIRMMVADVLADAGFAVIEAEHADEALAVLRRRADGIDLLFTDVHMPGTIDGIELAHHVHRQWPYIAVLISSGKARPEQDSLPPGSRFLPKPYRVNEMLDHVYKLTTAA